MRAQSLAGLRRYQHAERRPRQHERQISVRHGRARLLHYGAGAKGGGAPVVLIPSLINPPDVLDLDEGTSLLRFLIGEGLDAHLLDWGAPTAEDVGQDIGGHVTDLLLPLLARLGRPALLVGYCLGGTMALAAAACAPDRVAGVATIAAPWRFAGYDGTFRGQIAALWAEARPTCAALGCVPMEVLQTGFWNLDPARTVRKFARYAGLPEDSGAARAFETLEDWANEGAPLTLAAGRDLVEHFYGADGPGTGGWRVGGVAVDPAALACPSLGIRSTTDRLVPAAAAPPAHETLSLALGHVGMVVGRQGPEALWRPLAGWLSRQAGGC